MFKKIIHIIILFIGTLLFHPGVYAQCSMCRASMENSISRDSDQFSAGLNVGILYLFIMPYLLFGLIAFFWYRTSKKNGEKIKIKIRPVRKMP
jgi:hypothetical protein